MSINPAKPGHTRGEWAGQVGRFMLSFGELEHTLALLITKIAKDEIHESVSKMSFDFRVGFLEELLIPFDLNSDHPLRRLIKELRLLSMQRNLVAHNTIYFIAEGAPENDHIAIISLRDGNKRLKYDELLALADRSERAAKALQTPAESLSLGLKLNEIVWP